MVASAKRKSTNVPDRGDLVWLTFDPHAGHEQAGRRPAVVLSPKTYNAKSGLALLCPVTSQVKGYPFEVLLPEGFPVTGAIISDQLRSLDWKAHRATRICPIPPETIDEVLGKVQALLTP